MAKWILKILIALVMSLTCFNQPLYAQISDAEVKAAMMIRFADFIYWPEKAQQSRLDSELVISVLGHSSVASVLQNNMEIPGQPKDYVRVQIINHVSQLNHSHILFIPQENKKDIKPFLEYAYLHHILIITEMDELNRKKVMINFITENNRIRFEINPEIVEQNRFKISSRLMRIARIVASR